MKTRILCTLGPASLRGDVLRPLGQRVDQLWVDTATTAPEVLESTLELARRYARHLPICLQVGGRRDPAPHDGGTDLEPSDTDAIAIGLRHGIRHLARSSVRTPSDIERLRTLMPSHAIVIGMIDSDAALRQRHAVIELADVVVIDRAYLARTVPIEYVVHYQRAIMGEARRVGRPTYVVNGHGEPLMTAAPTVAQSNDIANCLLDGAAGVLLGPETATGRDPLRSVDRVRRTMQAFEQQTAAWILEAAGDLAGSGRRPSPSLS
jgi:pyruvate kinase